MIYLPSVSKDHKELFIYEIEESIMQWDDDENCFFVDLSDEDYKDQASVITIAGDPDKYTFLYFKRKNYYKTLNHAKRKMFEKLFN